MIGGGGNGAAFDQRKGSAMSSTLFLRRVLAVDALSCAAMGVVMTLGASPLAELFGLPAGLVRGAGMILLPTFAFIGWLSTRRVPPRPLVWLVIAGNLGWTVESFILIGQYAGSATLIGSAFVTVQGLAVLGLAALEYFGLRRIKASAA